MATLFRFVHLAALALGLALPGPARTAELPYQRALRGDDAHKAETLEREMEQLQDANRYRDAARKAEELRALRAAALGEDHWQTIEIRWHREALEKLVKVTADPRGELRSLQQVLADAARLANQGNWSKAEPLLDDALTRRRRLFGDDHPELARSLALLASNDARLGRAERAEARFRDAHERHRRLLGEDHPETVSALANLAGVLSGRNRFAEAEPLYHRALAGLERQLGPESPRTLTLRNNLAMHLSECGRAVEAEALLREVLATGRRVFGEEHSETGRAYNNLAFNLYHRGRFTEAEPLFRRAAASCRRHLGDDHPQTATAYSNLATALDRQGRVAEAEPLLRRAVEIWRARVGEGHRLTQAGLNNLATNLDDQGRYAEGEALLRATLEARRRSGDGDGETAAVLQHNLASCLGAQGRHAEAVTLLREALDTRERLFGADHPRSSDTRSNLAYHLGHLDRGNEAEALDRQTLEARRRALGDDHPLTADSYHNLVRPLLRRGAFAEGEPLLRRALTIRVATLGETHPLTVQSRTSLATVLAEQGKYAEAERELFRAAGGFEAGRLRTTAGGLGRAAFAAERSPFPHLAVLAARAGRPADAWRHLEANLARGLLDDFSARAVRILRPEESARERELLAELADLDTALVAASAEAEGRREGVARRQALLDRLGEHAAVIAAREVYDLERIRSHLPEDTALVAWLDLAGHPQSTDPNGDHWACLVRRTGLPSWVRLPGTGPGGAWTAEDDSLAERLRAELRSGGDGPPGRWEDLARQLTRQRLAPLTPHLAARAELPAVRRLVVLPSAHLAGIPLEVMAESYTVSYSPSGTLLARLCAARPATAPTPWSLLAVADPDFTAMAGVERSARLPGTRREAEAIARLFPEKELLLGADASEEKLAERASAGRLSRYRVLHLATHGEADERTALRSALILTVGQASSGVDGALAAGPHRDGRLTAEEVLVGWKMRADLVTLSACGSGLGKYQGGEGHVGFAQAFLLAGAQSLVVSLWPVDDTATALLMVRFYENLLGRREGLDRRLGKAEALREAKDWLRTLAEKELDEAARRLPRLERAKERTKKAAATALQRPFGHPYYWSAFILIGDPE